jgi:Transglycosylase SLT domain
MNTVLKSVFAAVLLASMADAADLAILRNGNSIRHERRQTVGAVTRLYFGESSNGYIEIPTDQIDRFEADTAPVVPAAASRVDVKPAQPVHVPATTPAQATAVSRADLNSMVAGAGERHQIDPDFINSVIRAESGFHSNAVSKKGAQGLMQLMPGTASQLGVSNPFDPNSNVEGGTKYLRDLLEKYNYDPVKALAAYNAGSRRVDKYHGVPPYYETQAYIARIIRDYNRQKIAENPALGRNTPPRAWKAAALKKSPQASAARIRPTPAKPAAQASNITKAAIATSIAPQGSH